MCCPEMRRVHRQGKRRRCAPGKSRIARQRTSEDESHVFERKGLAVSGRQLQKIATAFANADLVIGIKDDKQQPDVSKRWDGARKLEDLNQHLQSLFDVKPTLDLRYRAHQQHQDR